MFFLVVVSQFPPLVYHLNCFRLILSVNVIKISIIVRIIGPTSPGLIQKVSIAVRFLFKKMGDGINPETISTTVKPESQHILK